MHLWLLFHLKVCHKNEYQNFYVLEAACYGSCPTEETDSLRIVRCNVRSYFIKAQSFYNIFLVL